MTIRDLKYRLIRFFLLLLLPMFTAIGLTSCIYDDFDNDPDYPFIDTEGFSLGLTISLDDLQSRADTDNGPDGGYDSYIDTQNKFRVLFFTAQGQFIFEAIDRTVMPRTTNDGKLEWFVHIPVNYIVDSGGNAYDVEALKTQLKDNDFKVAILANWPNVDSNGDPCDISKAEPNWGINESIYGSNTKNINDLHHLVFDSNYNNTSSSSNRPSRQEVYGFLMDNEGKMGIRTDWVKARGDMGITSRETAETWIRNNWDPSTDDRNNNQYNYRYYADLWYLWNFNGALRYDDSSYDDNTDNAAIKRKWRDKNYNELNYWLYYGYNNLPEFSRIDGGANFKFMRGSGYTYPSVTSRNSNYAIVLPQGDYQNNAIKFTCFATGLIIVKYGARYNNQSATIYLDRRNKEDSKEEDEQKRVSTTNYNGWDTYTWEKSITGDSEYISIYCSEGTALIYEVEYIAEKYLYDTDREGILPSEENPIPMYGVQNYKKLENWQPGTTFDLSHERKENGTYEEKTISLIRSLAKVEVYLPTDQGKPRHIYMRSMNRTARCEPVDVETPTNTLWKEDNHNLASNSKGACEWYDIQEHGTFYTGGQKKDDTTSPDKTKAYQSQLSWYYGSWQNASWKNNGRNGWDFSGVNVPNSNFYPHLFNPSIDRSDFTHMIEVSSDRSGYYKYILYVPDKNIDDPNYVGISQSITKVAHIEYRYTDQDDINLDDNNCYRIYFTNYRSTGYKPNPDITKVSKTDFDNGYELSDTLSRHWPIMRNHVYTFQVTGTRTRSGEPEIISDVTTWGGQSLIDNMQ